jgi:hypothetical protein
MTLDELKKQYGEAVWQLKLIQARIQQLEGQLAEEHNKQVKQGEKNGSTDPTYQNDPGD